MRKISILIETIAVIFFTFVIMGLVTATTQKPLQQISQYGIFITIALSQSIGIALTGTIYLKLIYPNNPFKKIKIKYSKNDPTYIITITITILIISILMTYISTKLGFQPAENTVKQYLQNKTSILIFVILSFIIIGPIEEYFYRGIIQQRLKDQYKPTNAIILTSIIFSLIHALSMTGQLLGYIPYFITIFIGALIFGYSYEKTQNLLVPIISHSAYNALLAISIPLSYSLTP